MGWNKVHFVFCVSQNLKSLWLPFFHVAGERLQTLWLFKKVWIILYYICRWTDCAIWLYPHKHNLKVKMKWLTLQSVGLSPYSAVWLSLTSLSPGPQLRGHVDKRQTAVSGGGKGASIFGSDMRQLDLLGLFWTSVNLCFLICRGELKVIKGLSAPKYICS